MADRTHHLLSNGPRPILGFESFARQLCRELDIDISPDHLVKETLLIEDLGIDSLALVEILAFLFENGTLVDDEEFARMSTLGEVYELYVVHAAVPQL